MLDLDGVGGACEAVWWRGMLVEGLVWTLGRMRRWGAGELGSYALSSLEVMLLGSDMVAYDGDP